MEKENIKYFISYAHDDSAFFAVFKKGIVKHLKTSNKYNFTAWDDSEIPAGSSWNNIIQKSLSESKMAILCVSTNFLNSDYIQTNEFAVLRNQFPGTVIIPVYFNHCNFEAWEELSQIQFFKPGGSSYGKPGDEKFAFCDLVKFDGTNALIPNSNTDSYLLDLRIKIENALKSKYPFTEFSPEQEPAKIKSDTGNFEKINNGAANFKEKDISTDKIVKNIIVAFMVLSALLVFYTLFFNKLNTETAYKSSIGCVMFFGGSALYMINGKNKNKAVS